MEENVQKAKHWTAFFIIIQLLSTPAIIVLSIHCVTGISIVQLNTELLFTFMDNMSHLDGNYSYKYSQIKKGDENVH